jgi:hypothetical protein
MPGISLNFCVEIVPAVAVWGCPSRNPPSLLLRVGVDDRVAGHLDVGVAIVHKG